MKRKYKVDITTGAGFEELIQAIEACPNYLQERAEILCQKLAERGAYIASIGFASAEYKGPRDAKVFVEPRGENRYAVVANGETVLFIEFGSGITYAASGHPQAGDNGMGPGTYPEGKGHWNDPKGWWIPKDHGGGHTYGNPAGMPMYSAARDLEQDLQKIVQEVF